MKWATGLCWLAAVGLGVRACLSVDDRQNFSFAELAVLFAVFVIGPVFLFLKSNVLGAANEREADSDNLSQDISELRNDVEKVVRDVKRVAKGVSKGSKAGVGSKS